MEGTTVTKDKSRILAVHTHATSSLLLHGSKEAEVIQLKQFLRVTEVQELHIVLQSGTNVPEKATCADPSKIGKALCMATWVAI